MTVRNSERIRIYDMGNNERIVSNYHSKELLEELEKQHGYNLQGKNHYSRLSPGAIGEVLNEILFFFH